MFDEENDSGVIKSLLSESNEFRELYNRHRELDKRVHAAEVGARPMEDLALVQLKKEKLWTRDKMTQMLNQYRTSAH